MNVSEHASGCERFMGGSRPSEDRRAFLKSLGAASAAIWAAQQAAATPELQVNHSLLPQIRLGRYTISRLICGTNPFNGGSHLSTFVNQAMKEYYTPEQILKTLRRCEEVGINCWQAGVRNAELYRQFRDTGLQMHYIAIAAGKPDTIKVLSECGCIAIAHHGEVTDRSFKEGHIDQIHDYLKRVRAAGLLVGGSTPMPDAVDTLEARGWDDDY